MIVVPFRTPEDHARAVPGVAEHLRSGGLIAYPTETVYGLGCMLDPSALDRLAEMKGREGVKPFLLLVSDRAPAEGLEWNGAARRLAEAFWPGPLTLVLRAERLYPERVRAASGTVAVRATSHPGVRTLLDTVGEPITSTSVNLPGEPPASTLEQVVQVIESLGAPVEPWVLDGGPLPASAPSTIVDCSVIPPRILRTGAISRETLRSVLGEIND